MWCGGENSVVFQNKSVLRIKFLIKQKKCRSCFFFLCGPAVPRTGLKNIIEPFKLLEDLNKMMGSNFSRTRPSFLQHAELSASCLCIRVLSCPPSWFSKRRMEPCTPSSSNTETIWGRTSSSCRSSLSWIRYLLSLIPFFKIVLYYSIQTWYLAVEEGEPGLEVDALQSSGHQQQAR